MSESRGIFSRSNVLPPFPKNYFLTIGGTLTITDKEVYFNADKDKHSNYEFNIALDEIENAKKWGALFVPNPWFLPIMIKVKTIDGGKTVLVTSKRGKILSLLNDKSS